MKIGQSHSLSLMAGRHLERTQKALAKSLERLASGSRINRAADDPAGMAMANRLKGERSVTLGDLRATQAWRQELVRGDAQLQSQLELVQRMRELAVQAANGIVSDADRNLLQEEFSQLYAEFQRLSAPIEYDGRSIFDPTPSEVFTDTYSAGRFEESREIVTGTGGNNTYEIAVGDLNGDGILDLVTGLGNGGGNGVISRLGYGDGTFAPAVTLSLGNSVRLPVLGDVNGDGILDLVTTLPSSDVTNIHFGVGDGTFTNRQTISGGRFNPVTLADIDGDGDLDLLTPNASLSVTRLYLNDGNGTFTFNATLVATGSDNRARVADLNGDGRMDVVVQSSFNDNVTIFLQQSNGTFAAGVPHQMAGAGLGVSGLQIADMNGDGILDLVGLDGTAQSITVALGKGNGTFQTRTTSFVGSAVGANNLLIQDINGDGILDAVVLHGDPNSTSITIAHGNGRGGFVATSGIDEGLTLNGNPALADMDGDGVLDLIFSSRDTNRVYIYKGLEEERSGLSDLGVSTLEKATRSLSILDNARDAILSAMSRSGAYQSALGFREDAQLRLSENLSEAISRIEDVDIAEEMSEVARLQVQQQVQAAVLGQANLQLRLILDLLQRRQR